MDHQSIVDHNLSSSAMAGDVLSTSPTRSVPPSVSAGIAAANMHQPRSLEVGQRFPGEDGGHSLAAMAYSDLDAALQLLAERAQYITGASGVVIALRRGEHNDMLCRASIGSNAPTLGALLSMEYGFSGESVRSRQALRCDDAERDPRVNREGCRELGIASVVVMPVVSDQQVLGVFELFSGKPHAFAERDLSALQRLSEMVETAVKYAVAAQTMLAVEEPPVAASQPDLDETKPEVEMLESPATPAGPELASASPEEEDFLLQDPEETAPAGTQLASTEPAKTELEKTELVTTQLGTTQLETAPEPAPKKPLFWSAPAQTPGSPVRTDKAAESIVAPPVLRNLHTCQACGFPVSQGRKFCVECEEKQWRGQRLAQTSAGATQQVQPPHVNRTIEPRSGIPILKDTSPTHTLAGHPSARPVTGTAEKLTPAAIESPPASPHTLKAPQDVRSNVQKHLAGSDKSGSDKSGSDKSILFLSSAAESESWLAANKYVLGALMVVAIVIAAIAWLY
jgi:GAF domain-containing protein